MKVLGKRYLGLLVESTLVEPFQHFLFFCWCLLLSCQQMRKRAYNSCGGLSESAEVQSKKKQRGIVKLVQQPALKVNDWFFQPED